MKRILTYLALAAMTVMTLASCSEEKRKKALLPNISGKAGEVIIVLDKSEWEGDIGITLRDTLAADCPFLPQAEPLYTLVDVAPSGFNNMFQIHRNIIIINVGSDVTEPGVVIRQNVWAAPQCVISVNAPDSDTAVALIKENSRKIITTLEQAERDRVISNTKKYEELSIAPVITDIFGGSPHFPSGYKIKSRTSDFIWVTYAPQDTQQSILIFKYPVVDGEDMMSRESLTTNINAMLQKNVPGMFENTYMTIAPVIAPSITYMNYKGHGFAEIRGLWEVHNDFMGGPFVAHAFYSKDGKDMIVMLAFVYAPKYDKRQYLRQIESVLYSFEWKEEETEGRK
ncbi:MAG: DUF4837 family protein [Bacteroidales bacterium]|nr:DUF4837 family protein [Bacteroidales bacterium]